MSTKIQLRRDSAASWASVNPILAQGEPGAETDTGKLKIGDGLTRWNLLSYVKPDTNAAGTEKLWLASIPDCNNFYVKTSKDGLNWTRTFNPIPKTSGFWWQNAWFAKPMGGKVIYDLYVNYLGTETLGVSDNATDYPRPVTFTNLPTTHVVDTYNWWDVQYLNNKFIAVGAHYEVGTSGIARPMFAYSDDGETWTYGSIDEAFTENLVGDSGGKAEGIYINSVSWNGTGYLFSLEWDYNFGGTSLDNPPGMFYVSSLTTQLGTNNYFKPAIDNNYGLRRMTWNHDHWVALALQAIEQESYIAFNSNTNPRQGTWTVVNVSSTSTTGPQVLVFGNTTDVDNNWDAFTSGKIGSDYWDVIGHASGRVMATKDKGVTWVGSVPFNTFTSLDSIYYDGGEGSVVARFYKPMLNSGEYTPYSGDRVEIRYSATPALNGIFYLNSNDGTDPEEWGLRLDQARTQNLPNPQAIVNGYMGSQGGDGYGGPALITFSRDAGDNLLDNPYSGFGGFDTLVIADDKIVAINAHLWAVSENLNVVNPWTLSIQSDIFTVQSFGTSDLAYGSTGRTSQNSLQYVSDSKLVTEFWKELGYGYLGSNGIIPPSVKWSFDAFGNYSNQLVLAENFQVDIGGGGTYGNPTSMGIDGGGHWWLGYDARNSQTGSTPFSGGEFSQDTTIMNSDELNPGFRDILIGTDLFTSNSGPYYWLFDRNGKLTTPGKLYFDGTTITTVQPTDTDSSRPVITLRGQNQTNYYGREGGDVYIEGGFSYNNGGDIKIDAGGADGPESGADASVNGGTIKIRAGYSGSTGRAGIVHIEGGQATAGRSGDVEIRAWAGAISSGTVVIKTNIDQIDSGNPGNAIVNGGNNANMKTWQFDAQGTTTFPGAIVASKTPEIVGTSTFSVIGDATILDLTKQVQFLDAGSVDVQVHYYLADGEEGQIMYFAAKESTNMHQIIVHCDTIRYRNNASVTGQGDWIPFFDPVSVPPGRTMGTGVFIGGAWNFDFGDVN